MKRLIASLALSATAALAAQYPLNRVSSVTSTGSAGIGTNEVEDIVRLYDETNLTERLGSLSDRIDGKQGVMHALDGIYIDPDNGISVPRWTVVSNAALTARRADDNTSHTDGYSYGPWDMTEIRSKWGDVQHDLRVEPSGSGFVWALYAGAELEATSAAYGSERQALATTNVVVTGGGRSATATRESVKTSVSGDSFVTWQLVTNNQALAGLESRVNSRTDAGLAAKRDLVNNVCVSPAGRVLDEWWDVNGLLDRMADRGWGFSLSSRATMTYDDDVGEYVLTFSAKLPGSAGTVYTGQLYGFTGIKTKAEFDNTGRVELKMYYRGNLWTYFERYENLDSLVSRPYAPIAVPGEPYVTETFVSNTVTDAVAFSVTSNGAGLVSLDADPRKLLFGSVNLSNLVVNIVKEVMKNRDFLATFGISTNDTMTTTVPGYRIRPEYGPGGN